MSDDIDRSDWTEQDYQAERVGQQLTEIATGHPVPEPPPPSRRTLWQSLRAGLTGWRLQALLVVFALAVLVIIWNLITTYVELGRGEPGPFDAAAGPVGQVDAEAGAPAAAEADATEGAGVQPGDPVEMGEPGAGEEIQEPPGEPGGPAVSDAAGEYRVSESSVAQALASEVDRLESASGSISVDVDGRISGRFVFVYWGMMGDIADDPFAARVTGEHALQSPSGVASVDGRLSFEGTVVETVVAEASELERPVTGTVTWSVIGRIDPDSDLLQLTLSDDAGFEFAVEFQR